MVWKLSMMFESLEQSVCVKHKQNNNYSCKFMMKLKLENPSQKSFGRRPRRLGAKGEYGEIPCKKLNPELFPYIVFDEDI